MLLPGPFRRAAHRGARVCVARSCRGDGGPPRADCLVATGLRFAAPPYPGARPAETPAERLRQLRDLVREFHASVDVDTEPTELRLLPQPVARFAGGDANATATRAEPPAHPTRR